MATRRPLQEPPVRNIDEIKKRASKFLKGKERGYKKTHIPPKKIEEILEESDYLIKEMGMKISTGIKVDGKYDNQFYQLIEILEKESKESKIDYSTTIYNLKQRYNSLKNC